MDLDWTRLSRIDQIRFANDEHHRDTISMYNKAVHYVNEQKWCLGVKEGHVGLSEAGLIGVFLLRVDRVDKGDDLLWVVVGDVPSLYISTRFARNQYQALNSYVGEVDHWIHLAESGGTLDAAAPLEHGHSAVELLSLRKRLDILDRHFLKSNSYLL